MSTDAYKGKPIGLQNLTVFPVLDDPANGVTTYKEAIKLGRAIKATITPVFASAKLESDDCIEDDLTLAVGYNISIDSSQISNAVRGEIWGHTYDDNGGLVINKTDTPRWVALAFKSLLSVEGGKEKYAYVVLYKGRLAEFAENFETLKQGNITFQTHNGITGSFVPRESDGALKYSVREDDPKFKPESAANWFTKPQEKLVVPSP